MIFAKCEKIRMKNIIPLCFLLGLAFKSNAQSDVSNLIPINELGTDTYKGHTGGLYPNGSNEMPPAFYADAIEMAKAIQPLGADGNPVANGKIGLLTIGASTVAMFSRGIEMGLAKQTGLNEELVFINGGVGGQDISDIRSPGANYWKVVNERLASAGLSNEQVQVIWFQEDNLRDRGNEFPGRGERLADEFIYMVQFMKNRYPNLKLLYLTARHTTAFLPADARGKHKEPMAYINGWACKWMIEKQIEGDKTLTYKGSDAQAPLILWGPYWWTQGSKPRQDGYTWTPDMVVDGVHPTEEGRRRVGQELVDFWRTDEVSKIWFLEDGQATIIPVLAYMSFKINNELVDRVLHDQINGPIHFLVLQDSTIVYEANGIEKTDTLQIAIDNPGQYKYLISDEASLAVAGGFEIDSSGYLNILSMPNDTSTSTPIIEAAGKAPKAEINPNEPALVINGANKMPKMKRALAGNDVVKAVITDSSGKAVLTIEDFLNKHTDLNSELERGEYKLVFYDAEGEIIPMPSQFSGTIRVK